MNALEQKYNTLCVLCRAAVHALRAYEHGNASPDQAKSAADQIERALESGLQGSTLIYDPGNYDDECTRARVSAGAIGAALIIFGGSRGNGFSVQLPPEAVAQLPEILRELADDVARQWQTHLAQTMTGPKS